MAGETSPRSLVEMRRAVERLVGRARAQHDRKRLIDALAALVEICDRQEDWAGMAAAAEELVALTGADAEVWTALADARLNLGDLARAVQAFAQATALAPDEPMLRRNYAWALILSERFGEAAFQLDVAARLDPGSPFLALHWAELAMAQGDRAEARRLAEEALRRQPGLADAGRILKWVTDTDAAESKGPSSIGQ